VNGIYSDTKPIAALSPVLLAAFSPLPVEVAYRCDLAGQVGAIGGAMKRVGARGERSEAQKSAVECVNPVDSKSRSLYGECGFNSLLRHQFSNTFRLPLMPLDPIVG